MTHEEIIAMAREAGIEFQSHVGVLGRTNTTTSGSQSIDKIQRLIELAAAKERERLFGKAQRDGEMRLMLHRWEGGQCFAAAAHFNAEQTHCGPDDLLQMAVGRLDDSLDAGIAAAIRAQEQKDGCRATLSASSSS